MHGGAQSAHFWRQVNGRMMWQCLTFGWRTDMPYADKDKRLAYQRERYHARKSEYESNPARKRTRVSGMDARKELLEASMIRYVWPGEIVKVCSEHAYKADVKTDGVIEICTRTLKGASEYGLFLGEVLFGEPRFRNEFQKAKAEKFKKLISKKAFREIPELLILQLEIEDPQNGRKPAYDVWRCSPDDY
jgi:hypothetical protein